jgi:hypothetical protein
MFGDSGVINARDYGAKGDGLTDDAPALQRAIDAAQHSRKLLAVPAGVYLVNATLHVRDNSGSTSGAKQPAWNCSFAPDDNLAGPSTCPAALHMVGDGGWGLQTVIKGGGPGMVPDAEGGSAIIDVGYGKPGPSVPRAGPAHGHEFSDFVIDGAGKAFHGIRAYAIIRSLVHGVVIMGAIDIGLELGAALSLYAPSGSTLSCTPAGATVFLWDHSRPAVDWLPLKY